MNYIKLKDLSILKKVIYGLPASAHQFSENYPKYLKITDIDDFGNIPNKLPTSVDINIYQNGSKFLLKKNDIVFARTVSVGRYYFFDSKNRTIIFSGYLIKFSINTYYIVPKYISYYCKSAQY